MAEEIKLDVIKKSKSAKAEAFKRVAEKRTRKVLESLRLLGQCSNRRSYEYTDEQILKIFREIRSSLRRAEQSFDTTTDNKKSSKFTL
jgi:hypothetical protein